MSGPVRLKIVRGIGLQRTTRVYKLVRAGGRGPAGPGLPPGTDPADINKLARFIGPGSFAYELFTLTKSFIGLGNVTDDAQLKRSAGDYQGFAQKINIDGTESLISEDGSDGENKKRITVEGVATYVASVAPGDINYANPIAVDSTSIITPTDGDYFTSTSKIVTLTGSGSEKFLPNGAETSRIIWGTGASVAADITINPTNLSVGDIFEISLDGGESRVLMYDATDFLKIGGRIIILRCSMWGDNPSITLVDNVDTVVPLTDVTLDNSGQMADTINEVIKIIRVGQYNGIANLVFEDPTSTPSFNHETQVRVISSISPSPAVIRGLILTGQLIGAGNNNADLSPNKIYAVDETLELRAIQQTIGGTESLQVRGGQSNPAHQFVSIEEIDPW